MTALLVRKRLCVIVYSDGGRGLCVFGGLCVDMWRLVHQYSFFAVLTVFWLFLTIGTVYHSSKTVNSQNTYSQNSKNDHWCTNRHMSTQSLPNTQSRANSATLRYLHHTCLGSCHSSSPVGRADCTCLHGRPCVWLPFAAACCYTLFYLLMMPVARLVCQRPSSNFPHFRTSLANFLLSRPNSVQYGRLILKQLHCCTRPLFQGRTGCGGRPSGWHYRHMPASSYFCAHWFFVGYFVSVWFGAVD